MLHKECIGTLSRDLVRSPIRGVGVGVGVKGFTINGFRGQEDSSSRVYVCIVILFRETVEIVLMLKNRDRA